MDRYLVIGRLQKIWLFVNLCSIYENIKKGDFQSEIVFLVRRACRTSEVQTLWGTRY